MPFLFIVFLFAYRCVAFASQSHSSWLLFCCCLNIHLMTHQLIYVFIWFFYVIWFAFFAFVYYYFSLYLSFFYIYRCFLLFFVYWFISIGFPIQHFPINTYNQFMYSSFGFDWSNWIKWSKNEIKRNEIQWSDQKSIGWNDIGLLTRSIVEKRFLRLNVHGVLQEGEYRPYDEETVYRRI